MTTTTLDAATYTLLPVWPLLAALIALLVALSALLWLLLASRGPRLDHRWIREDRDLPARHPGLDFEPWPPQPLGHQAMVRGSGADSEGPGRSHHQVSAPGPTPGGGKAAPAEDTTLEEGHHA